LPPLLVQLLYNRGMIEPEQMRLFLAGDEGLASDPFLLPSMQLATARIYRALLSAEKIVVYGDFDVDGITGTALMVQGLTGLGGRVDPYIPHRVSEGHGLRIAAIEELHQQGCNLIVTVDCGITDVEEVKRAKKLGIDVIITDHHTPPSALPDAFAIVDPKLPDSRYPFTELAGVGVAYKVLQALLSTLGKEDQLDRVTDLVAIGTIADMVPLAGENRYLVRRGLKQINISARLGIKEIIKRAGQNQGNLDTDSITWCIAPWLNASGRLEHAMASYKLLMTDLPAEAQELALLVGQKNTERQRLTSKVLAEAKQQIAAAGVAPLIVVSSTDYPLGIAGPVAGRLADEYYRPVIVVKLDDKSCSGSCRSIPEFNIIAALNQCSDLLSRFGGHAQAAGFTILTKNLPLFQECLSQIVAHQLEGVDLHPRIDIDAEVSLGELGGNTFQTIQKLAPFGKGNPVPTFLSRSVEVTDCRTMGSGQEHLKLKLRQGGMRWDSVAFRAGESKGDVSPLLDIVYNLEADRWSGEESLRLNILSFAPADSE
jgi:single-stranded-DNA-specific exonuclease